jgi:uridylate kinase
MEPVVLSLGGSVLITDGDDVAYVRDLSKLLVEVSHTRSLMVVTGGGRVARHYIRSARALGAPEEILDEMGIAVTRLNARVLALALGNDASQTIPKDYDEAVNEARTHPIVVMGGVSPGITTDAVAAMLAEHAGARLLVNATSVDGAYTSDPGKDSSATRIPELSHDALVKLVAGTPSGAGPNVVFDPTGARVIERSDITLAIVNGRDLENLKAALLGQSFHGTIVR